MQVKLSGKECSELGRYCTKLVSVTTKFLITCKRWHVWMTPLSSFSPCSWTMVDGEQGWEGGVRLHYI